MTDSGVPPTETRWLIERGQSEKQAPTVWWAGDANWVEDAFLAVKFLTREEAERACAERSGYVGDRFGRVTEHSWLQQMVAAVASDAKLRTYPNSPPPTEKTEGNKK